MLDWRLNASQGRWEGYPPEATHPTFWYWIPAGWGFGALFRIDRLDYSGYGLFVAVGHEFMLRQAAERLHKQLSAV